MRIDSPGKRARRIVTWETDCNVKRRPGPPHRLMRGTLRRLQAEKPRSSCGKHQPQLGFLDRANTWGWLHPWRGLSPWTRRSGSMLFEPQVVARCPRREVRILC